MLDVGEAEERTARSVEPGPGLLARLALPNAVVAMAEVNDDADADADAELVVVTVRVEAEVATRADVETEVVIEAEVEAKSEVVVEVDGKGESEVDTKLKLDGAEAAGASPLEVPAASWNTRDEVLQHAVLANAAFSQQ